MSKGSYIAVLMICLILVMIFKTYDTMAFVVTGITVINLISKFSKTFIIPDVIASYSCLLYLIGPYLGYKYFVKTYKLSLILDQWMKVPKEEYYTYAFPAIILFIIGLNLFRMSKESDVLSDTLNRLKETLEPKNGYLLIIIGVFAYYTRYSVPVFLQYILTITFLMVFAGFLILYFSPKGGLLRQITLAGLSLWILFYGIRSSMFTIVFYMGITMIGIIFLDKKISVSKKIIGLILSIVFTMSLQFVKSNYRLLIRRGVEREITIGTFFRLFVSTIKNIDKSLELQNLFPLYLRFNNGYNLALVMNRIPHRQPFDHGDALNKSFLSVFVPRLLWPDKPIAGGMFNMKYYAGIKIDTFTTNVGPIGEAYGAFGKIGGSVFMLFFGILIGLAHTLFIKISYLKPNLLVFMPMLFYEIIYCMENDTLQAFNSLIKTSFFLIVFFFVFPRILNPKENKAALHTV